MIAKMIIKEIIKKENNNMFKKRIVNKIARKNHKMMDLRLKLKKKVVNKNITNLKKNKIKNKTKK